ncbi:hypothetical protein GQ44DRAFT_753493 [Phaeosphaeriaceae sp. PMI808]|nr:hypothetical protein GQ44DRAFT_753493 [Phaeosphaeriaceae sp. PMI808]
MFDLEVLELDDAPTFIMRTSTAALDFELLYSNAALRSGDFRNIIIGKNRAALLFRSWTQAQGLPNGSTYDFAGWTWSATKSGLLKKIRATSPIWEESTLKMDYSMENREDSSESSKVSRNPAYESSKEHARKAVDEDRKLLVQIMPHTDLNARWEGIQTMLEMSDVGVFEYNTAGILLQANEAWYRLSSHPRNMSDHVQFSFMDLVFPDDIALVMSMWNKLINGIPVTFEMRWKSRTGTTDPFQWVLSSCVPIFDERKNLMAIAGNTIDIAAQKKPQEAAQARVEALEQARVSEMKFARFAQLSPTAIYIFVPETGMQFVNDQFFELTGHSNAPVDQFAWFDLIAEGDVKNVENNWADMLEGKKTFGVQFRLKKTCSSYPQVDEHGNVISIMGTLFDISQFKWAESVQRRRVEEALEAKRQQENFIDMTSHELRNPLSAVVQCAESVISTLENLPVALPTASFDQSRSNDFQNDINSSIDALHTIVSVIDDVLTLSKLDSNLILITPVRVQPSTVVSEAMKIFEIQCNQMNVQLDLVEDEILKGFEWIMLDPSRLLQVLINLLTNAIKFTKSQPIRNITVYPSKMLNTTSFTVGSGPKAEVFDHPDWGDGRKGYLWIEVTDTGCAMTDEEQKKLFSRFTQATQRTHVQYGGSGLGLFISKPLATLQGGAIGVSSKANVGLHFFPPAGRSSHVQPRFQRMTSTEDAMKAVKIHVLIVEDNLINQQVLKKQLDKFGWAVSVAGDGEEALDWLKNNEETSGVMPVDGITCARIIRDYEAQGFLTQPPPSRKSQSREFSPSFSPNVSPSDSGTLSEYSSRQKLRLPILAVSANARMEQIQQALAEEMDDVITKPFRIPELWPKVRRLIPRLSEDQEWRR